MIYHQRGNKGMMKIRVIQELSSKVDELNAKIKALEETK